MIKYLQFFGLFGKSINDNMEENLLGYNIYRSDDPGQTYTQLNSSLLTDTVYSDNIQISGMYYYYVKALYEEGISIPSNIDSVDVVVGIHNTESFNLTVYPNPAKDEIRINSGEPIQGVTFFNGIGDKVYSKETNTFSLKIPVSNLNQGIYIIKIQIGNDVVVKRVVIQR